MSSKRKIAIVCAVLICAAGVLWMATTGQRPQTTYTYSQFLDQVHGGQVASVIVTRSNSGAVSHAGAGKSEYGELGGEPRTAQAELRQDPAVTRAGRGE